MRLRQIKLAGFKSFVDPTQIDVPGQIVGVVGPNGCGKSNVIDAVRWVLGESKAAELRGESMLDVIFNGSTERKPAGRASVELVFDNSEGRIGGEWSRFSELSVKRVLTRDNASAYLINNQQVRRRDVHDLFLGTGLGPRAYAIIGQGTISRIVEAKPEDLRIFLEEAAGVSRYKERRKETESRLADARDNLTRVEDVLRELDSQIERLHKQAEVAREYRALTERHRDAQSLLWFTRREEGVAEQARRMREIEQAETQLEAQMADLRAVELRLVQERQAQDEANAGAQAAQADLARANEEVRKRDAQVRSTLESRARLVAHGDALAESRKRREAELAQLVQRRAGLEREAGEAQARLEAARAACREHEARVPESEAAANAAREAVTAARAQAASAQQAISGASAQMQGFDRQGNALAMRRERLSDEQSSLGAPDSARLDRLRSEIAALQADLEAAQTQGVQAEAQERDLQGQRQTRTEERSKASAELHRLDARLHAVRDTLAKMQADEKLDPWLRKQELQSLPRLFARLEVEGGWETAIEAVLRERIEAIEVGRLEPMTAFGTMAPPARVSFYARAERELPPPVKAPWPRLAESVRVRGGVESEGLRSVLEDWLAGVYVMPDLEQAMAARAELPAGAQFVVPGGHVVSRHGLRFFAPEDRKAGLLAHRRDAENLERQIKAQRLIDEQATEALARVEAQLRQAQEQARTARDRAAQMRTRLHQLQLESVRLAETIERIRNRSGQIESELDEIAREEAELNRHREEAETRFAELDGELGRHQEAVEAARVQDEQAAARLREARERLRQLESQRQRAEFEVSGLQDRRRDVDHGAGVATADIARLGDEIERARLEAAKLDDSGVRGELEEWLERQRQAERAATDARSRFDEWMQRARASDEQRQKIERGLQPRRDRITDLRLQEQAARLAVEQFDRQLAEVGVDGEPAHEALRALLAQAPAAAEQEREIARLAQTIADLGAVNLAALDELGAAQERQGFLRTQSEDLRTAVETLEDAIRKIDVESRALLQETFDKVNGHFGEMFPRLFGGGQARLSMTGDEILDAGVQLTAQPPGKRNSSIHLLSGGEKALTATALVFALFKLNPAPFCLLDEVDAPLDDANTERFCQLVRSMSDATQFLFISHNKIAMEMAQQLVGVTMQEQGVSRIVAVDLDSAVGMAESV